METQGKKQLPAPLKGSIFARGKKWDLSKLKTISYGASAVGDLTDKTIAKICAFGEKMSAILMVYALNKIIQIKNLIFKTKKQDNFLDVIKFNNLSNFSKKPIIALGGLNNKNIKRLNGFKYFSFILVSLRINRDQTSGHGLFTSHTTLFVTHTRHTKESTCSVSYDAGSRSDPK